MQQESPHSPRSTCGTSTRRRVVLLDEMSSRGLWISLVAGAAFVIASPASAGGSFEQIVGVGANGRSQTIQLRQTGLRSEAVLTGSKTGVPRGGFVRLYPMIGELPADPGRFYPVAHVLCLYWSEPASNCRHLGAAGIRLLLPFAKLPLRYREPTAPVEVRYRNRRLRYANGNIYAALELASERSATRRASPPPHSIQLEVRWEGPQARRRPSTVWLAPHGVYTPRRFSRLPLGSWCYLTFNLPHPSAALLEANNRLCS